jgi:hypothetical protein
VLARSEDHWISAWSYNKPTEIPGAFKRVSTKYLGRGGWMMMDGSNAGGYWGRGELRGKIECGVVSRVLGGIWRSGGNKPFFRRDAFVHVIYPIHCADESSKQPLFNSGFVPRRPHFLFSTGQTKLSDTPDPIGGLTQTCRKLLSIFLTTVWIYNVNFST